MIGSTDKQGAYVTRRPVSPADVACTVYEALGIDPRKPLRTPDGRPIEILDQGENGQGTLRRIESSVRTLTGVFGRVSIDAMRDVRVRPPAPLAQSFLVCREVFQDRQTGENLLIGPFSAMALPAYPAALRVTLYIRLTGAPWQLPAGSATLRSGRSAGRRMPGPRALHQDDPLVPCQICWRDLVLQFPKPGRHDLILLANGEDLSHHSLDLALQANG